MAQIIPFPGTTAAIVQEVVTVTAAAIVKGGANAPPTFPKVSKIRRWGRMPKANRPEDQETIMFARIARSWADKAYALAQTEPNSESHRLALHMVGVDHKLPRNNLRVFTTPEDVVQGIWRTWRRVNIASLEWELCDKRRWEAASDCDEDSRLYWAKQQEEADAKRWMLYERLIRIPASRLSDVTAYKLGRWGQGLGNLEWMRTHKPEIAAILDEEIQRLSAEKETRKVARAAKTARGV